MKRKTSVAAKKDSPPMQKPASKRPKAKDLVCDRQYYGATIDQLSIEDGSNRLFLTRGKGLPHEVSLREAAAWCSQIWLQQHLVEETHEHQEFDLNFHSSALSRLWALVEEALPSKSEEKEGAQ